MRLVKPAVDTFADAMEGNASGTALAAAKELLHRVLGDDWSPNDATVQPPRPAPSLMDLSPETKLQVLKELGGPLEERPDYPGLPAGGDLISADGARVGPFDGGEP